jgi:hypothetical protein
LGTPVVCVGSLANRRFWSARERKQGDVWSVQVNVSDPGGDGRYVARDKARAHIAALVDPAVIPPGVLYFAWLWNEGAVRLARNEPVASLLEPMLETATGLDDEWWRLVFTALTLLLVDPRVNNMVVV